MSCWIHNKTHDFLFHCLTLLEWNSNITKLVFCAGLCRIHLAPFQSHLLCQNYHDPGCSLQVSNSLCLKSIPTVFVTFSMVGRTHTVRLLWFKEKSIALSKRRAFRHRFITHIWLPGFLKARCVSSAVNKQNHTTFRLLPLEQQAAQFPCWAATANGLILFLSFLLIEKTRACKSNISRAKCKWSQ